MSFDKKPWASGPGEILNHGLKLLSQRDSDVNRRIAMISIDNSVELMVKTYLNLPSRITGVKITRREYAEFSESFPKLLDALEKHAGSKINGIDIGEIEWYHRLRNELYHQGNGLTVERQKVETYASIAKILFRNLYEFDLFDKPKDNDVLDLEKYLEIWGRFEFVIQTRNPVKTKRRSTVEILKELMDNNHIDVEDLGVLNEYRNYRNRLVHSTMTIEDLPLPRKSEYIPYMTSIINKIKGIEI
jgi:hypothetical protein